MFYLSMFNLKTINHKKNIKTKIPNFYFFKTISTPDIQLLTRTVLDKIGETSSKRHTKVSSQLDELLPVQKC